MCILFLGKTSLKNKVIYKVKINRNKTFMIKEDLFNLLEKINDLTIEVENYIKSNKNWVFYFLNTLVDSGANEPIFKMVKEFPDEWEDYIDFSILHINKANIDIAIDVDDGSELGISLRRTIYLPTFEETVKRNIKIYDGKINELRIERLKEEINGIKNHLEKKEIELATLMDEKL